jgi:hypothetical protein
MSEWISVNHDLPQVGQEIKFKIGELTYSEGKLASLTTIDYGSRRDVYGDFELEGRSKYKFTHWQPLPDPPKAEGPFIWTGEFVEYIECGQVRHSCRPYDTDFLVTWINRVLAVES